MPVPLQTQGQPAPAAPAAQTQSKRHQTLRICTNRTCRRQGSRQISKFAEDLGLTDLTIERTGCLGKCGNGPNVMLSPPDLVLGHVGTAARMTELLRSVAGRDVPDSLIKASELRVAGNALARSGKLAEAAERYSEALALEPPAGRHLLLSNRSGVLLSLGRVAEAAADADAAAAAAPPGFQTAFIRQAQPPGWLHCCSPAKGAFLGFSRQRRRLQVEARAAQQDAAAASMALEAAVARDPGFVRTLEHAQLRRLIEGLQAAA